MVYPVKFISMQPIRVYSERKTNQGETTMKKKLTKAEKKNETIETIAFHMGIETLETRNSDSLDFHDISVSNLKSALEKAFEAGRNAR